MKSSGGPDGKILEEDARREMYSGPQRPAFQRNWSLRSLRTRQGKSNESCSHSGNSDRTGVQIQIIYCGMSAKYLEAIKSVCLISSVLSLWFESSLIGSVNAQDSP